jgi:hypothetical protein
MSSRGRDANGLISLIADGIQHAPNVVTLLAAASMFGAECAFRGGVALDEIGLDTFPSPIRLNDPISVSAYQPLVALENRPGSESVFGARFPSRSCRGLLVGNEARGISERLLTATNRVVHIPMASGAISTLNVAAAAAVGLYAVTTGGFRSAEVRSESDRRRPELLIVGGADAFEVGSSIRSAAAFGWSRLFLQDRGTVWFNARRSMKVASQAAARRSRNSIRVIPSQPSVRASFARVCIFTQGEGNIPLHRANLAGSSDILLVVPDEQAINVDSEDWEVLGTSPQIIGLGVPNPLSLPRLRLTLSVALAEAARQIGTPPVRPIHPTRHEPTGYDKALRLGDVGAGEIIDLEDLLAF